MAKTSWCCALVLAAVAGCADDAAPQADPAADRASIEQVLRQWPHDFNDRNLDEVCGLFAEDVVVVYPEAGDRDHTTFCAGMADIFADREMTYRYDEPDIHEVLVDGDLATVRLTWTLTVADLTGAVLETVSEDGVDVFRRQEDGSWKIHISHAFSV